MSDPTPRVPTAPGRSLDTAPNARRILSAVGIGAVGLIGVTAVVVNSIGQRRPFSNIAPPLIFPQDLETYGISLSFQFAKYERRSIYKQPFERRLGQIRLPVPRQIVDRLGVEWGSEANQSVVGAAIESTLLETKYGTSTAASIKNIFGDSVAGASSLAAQAALTKANVPGVTLEAALQPLGFAVNPFLTVLFKQPNFKTHEFSWTLAAKNPEEATTINAIVQSFRYHMLPDIAKGSGGTLLNYPDMVHIRFFNNDSFLYRFKPCVVQSVSVDYAPEGPSFFKGSSNVPSQLRLSVSLLEIEYWVKGAIEEEMNTIQGGSI
jgi:hypothetical protein